MPALAVVVYRPFVGRHWAGTRPAPTMVALDSDSGRWSHPFLLSTLVGVTKGGVAGGVPLHKGGPKARPQNCSGR